MHLILLNNMLTVAKHCLVETKTTVTHGDPVILSSTEIGILLYLIFMFGYYGFLWWVSDGTPDSVIWLRRKWRKLRRRMRGDEPEDELEDEPED